MFKSIIAAVASIALATPGFAASWQDVKQLGELVKGTGTTITMKECKDNRAGSYQFQKDVIDELTICTDNVDMNDADAVWETLVHESVHVMQACAGDNIVKLEYQPRILRELKAHAPHYYQILSGYPAASKLRETEAFWMELQSPEVAIKWIQDFCYANNAE